MTKTLPINIERYRDIGAYLHDVRLKQKRSLVEMAESLNIRLAHLEAIERNQIDQLPGKAYARGFVVRYAEGLELDGDLVWSRYQKTQPLDTEPELYVPQQKRLHDIPSKQLLRGTAVVLAALVMVWHSQLPKLSRPLVDTSILEREAPQPTTEPAPAPSDSVKSLLAPIEQWQ